MLEQPLETGATAWDGVSARDFAAPQALPVRAAPGEPASGARSIPRLYVLLGILVACVTGLGVALTHQARIGAERARELAETRRLSEEMIALMKEARREAAPPAVAPQTPETTAGVATGEAGAPPQA
ncbi:MAG: hypothetical protein ACREQJ_01620, partial [Candidatus Binatia bacterium]